MVIIQIHGGARMHETIMQSLGMPGYKNHKNMPWRIEKHFGGGRVREYLGSPREHDEL